MMELKKSKIIGLSVLIFCIFKLTQANVHDKSLLSILKAEEIAVDYDENNLQTNNGILDLFSKNSSIKQTPNRKSINMGYIGNTSGYIESPGYPNPYTIPQTINYIFQLNSSLDVQLVFDEFNTRYGKDFVKIKFHFVDSDQKPMTEGSSTLILSGIFNQTLVFHAKNYEYLRIEFQTFNEQIDNLDAIGFMMHYKSLLTHLDDTSGILLPDTTTFLMSRLFKTPEDSSEHFTVTEHFLRSNKTSFCKIVNKINDRTGKNCSTDYVTQDLIIGYCYDPKDEKYSTNCIQIVDETVFSYNDLGFLMSTEMESPNPHENAMMWLAAMLGLTILIIVVIVAIMRSTTCTLNKKLKLNEENNEQNVIPVVMTDDLKHANHEGRGYDNFACDRTTESQETGACLNNEDNHVRERL